MREHLQDPVRVDELAKHISLSVSHFCRAFKETFGNTPHAHVIRLRLELAQKLMLTTEDSLTQIALASGLADQAHLSKLFRRWLGETPTTWRRQNLTDAQAEAKSLRSTGSGQSKAIPLPTPLRQPLDRSLSGPAAVPATPARILPMQPMLSADGAVGLRWI